MIKRKGTQWTTIQCQNCKDCHKVLNDKHMRAVLCPYCGTTIMLSKGSTPQVNSLEDLKAINNIAQVADIYKNDPPAEFGRFPKVREEDTVGYQQKK
jgi:ribosomal protein S27E